MGIFRRGAIYSDRWEGRAIHSIHLILVKGKSKGRYSGCRNGDSDMRFRGLAIEENSRCARGGVCRISTVCLDSRCRISGPSDQLCVPEIRPIREYFALSYRNKPHCDFCFIRILPLILVGLANSFLVEVADLPKMGDGRRLVRSWRVEVFRCDRGLTPPGGICNKFGRRGKWEFVKTVAKSL